MASRPAAVLQIVLDPECPVCHAVLDEPLLGPVCPTCWRAVARTRPARGAPTREPLAFPVGPADRFYDQPRHLAACRAIGVYAGTLRRIILAFKYGGHRALGPPLGALMRDAGLEVLTGAAAVVPVPLWAARGRARGFNQAEDLAGELGLPVWRVLRRRWPGLPQAALPSDDRHANVAGAYALRRTLAVAARIQLALGVAILPDLRGTTVVLVDDVMATGATLDACALVLRQAGVREVRAIVAARAVRRDAGR